MAASFTISNAVRLGGQLPGMIMLLGTVDLDTDTSVDIYDNAYGARKILSYSFTNSANENAFKVVKAYDASNDGDKLTLTGTAGDTFDFMIMAEDNGE